jgi:hypothetical protein
MVFNCSCCLVVDTAKHKLSDWNMANITKAQDFTGSRVRIHSHVVFARGGVVPEAKINRLLALFSII